MCRNGLCLEPSLQDRIAVLSCFDSSGCGVNFPSSVSYYHTEIRCFGHHRQAKRCVRDHKLWAMFGPADPLAWELGDPLTYRSKKNNTLGGIDVEPKRAKGVQDVCKISKGVQAVRNAVQRPADVDIICVYDQVLVQLFMGIPLKKFFHD